MIAVVQRVKSASVTVDNKIISEIDKGYLVLLGCQKGDDENDVNYISKKIAGLRIFKDNNEKMNLSIQDIKGQILIVSQFTLLAQTRKGNRPSFINAELSQKANELYTTVTDNLKNNDIDVQTGIFGAMMDVSLVNDGPVTIILDSKDKSK